MVSVIMPVLNGEKTIKDSIVSIINQTYTEWELIIVDNGSTDKTEDICSVFVNDNPKISYIHCLEKGVVSARFKGVQSAKGEYVAFIDADDRMCNNMLKKMIETAKRENADIVSCGYVNVTNEKKETCSPIAIQQINKTHKNGYIDKTPLSCGHLPY
ncbi:MAG: glycosyltransferase family A protein, partial [Methanosphaera sp.]|nr:glycosyltransferase family A protein [Methanosphaera sp.]